MTSTGVRFQEAVVGGTRVFWREAGHSSRPALLLLHGFPTSSHMFRHLIPKLAPHFHVVAPDLPGFGFSERLPPDAPPTFERLTSAVEGLVDSIGLRRYALYVFDYGAPVGFRLAMRRPARVAAIVSQNGNAYEEGLSRAWDPFRAYWRDPTPERRDALRSFLTLEATKWQYEQGTREPRCIAPESYALDALLMQQPGQVEYQLDLFRDYATNVELYAAFHRYFRQHQPPLLAAWGLNDPFFLPAGAQAYRRDLPGAEVHLLDTGHFALETHTTEIADLMVDFLGRVFQKEADGRRGATTDETRGTRHAAA